MSRMPMFALTALFCALPAFAADRSYTVAATSPALRLFPELKGAPAPAWVKPGTRLSFYNAAATIPSSYQMPPVLDPNGNMVDPTTGKSVRMDANASASGHGITQLDVIAVTDDAVVCRTNTYVISGVDGPVALAADGGFTTIPGAGYDWWVNPDILKKALGTLGGPGVRVANGPYKAAGKTFDAVWVSTSGNGASTSYVFDPAGGLTLHSTLCTSVASGTSLVNGVPTATGGSLSLGQNTFVGLRSASPPWAGSKLPPSVAKLTTLVYDGARVTTIGVSVTCPVRIALKVTGRGDNFLQVHKTILLDLQNGARPAQLDVDTVSGTGEFTPLAIPPEFLAKLRPGQELDRDPVTKIGVGFNGTTRGANGRPLAILTETAGGYTTRTDFAYDMESGLLVGATVTDPANHCQTTTTLRTAE